MLKLNLLFLFLALLYFFTAIACSHQSQIELMSYSVVSKDVSSTKIKLNLTFNGQDDYYIKQKSTIIKNPIFQFTALTYYDFNFKIYDPDNKRYQVPQTGIFPIDPQGNFTYPIDLAAYSISYQQNPFSFVIKRKYNNATLFSSSQKLIFSEYYIQIGTTVDSQNVFGLSQRFTNSYRLKPGKWTIFPRDRGQVMDKGTGMQTHGYYPVYLLRQKNITNHINYFRSTNALDVIAEQKDNSYLLTYKIIGGIIDFRFFLGQQNPEPLVEKFNAFMGKSTIPPFWSLGFHQSRWGYKNITALNNVIKGYQQNNIPLDTIWSDIDYMKQYETFTIDESRFPLDQMNKILQSYQYIPIVQPGIWYQKGQAYQTGHSQDVFIKEADGKTQQIGKVWVDQAVFVDWFNPASNQYWFDMLDTLYSKIKFSGVWLDMNQIANLCNGPCRTPNQTNATIDFSIDIPYHPGNDSIQTKAIPLNCTHYGNLTEQNVHSLFGFMQTYATNQFLIKKGLRPFIISRSSTLGSNKYGFHWTGDNFASFQFLKASIGSNFMFNLWGIQMVGSDICGFGGNSTQQICARWFQLGSLYPFSRNHNQDIANDQQAYALGSKVLQSSRKNLKLRYSILKAYYRQFITRKGLGAIFKPLWFQFYLDPNTLNDTVLDSQFMLGKYLMSTPIVQEGKTDRTVYFPSTYLTQEQNWYDFHTGKIYKAKSNAKITNQITDLVPLFIREKHFLFVQETENITKSRQLDSNFIMLGAYRKLRVNGSSTFYECNGGVLSIQNYNNQTLIQKCLTSDCDYQIYSLLQINKQTNKTNMTLEVLKLGSLSQTLHITSFKLYIPDNQILFTPKKSITINGNAKIAIDIDTQKKVKVQDKKVHVNAKQIQSQ